jgi:hypothetical protein
MWTFSNILVDQMEFKPLFDPMSSNIRCPAERGYDLPHVTTEARIAQHAQEYLCGRVSMTREAIING